MKYLIEIEVPDDDDHCADVVDGCDFLAARINDNFDHPSSIVCRNDIGDTIFESTVTEEDLENQVDKG